MATGRKAARATAVDFRDEFDEVEPDVSSSEPEPEAEAEPIDSEPEVDDFAEAEEEAARSNSLELSDLAQERLTQAQLRPPHEYPARLIAEAHILATLAVSEAVRELKASP